MRRAELEQAFEYGNDFGSPDETYISSQFDRPVMVHRYPAAVKAFYMEPDPADPKYALCVDVLAPEGYGEVIGGSQRIHSYELLKKRIEGTSCQSMRSSGIWIRGGTVRFRIRGLAWGLSAQWHGSAGWITCGRRFPLPER